MAGIQAFDALTRTAKRRRRLAAICVFARVCVLVATIVGARRAVVATVRHAVAAPAGAWVEAKVHGAEQSVAALRVRRARSRRTYLGVSEAV